MNICSFIVVVVKTLILNIHGKAFSVSDIEEHHSKQERRKQ